MSEEKKRELLDAIARADAAITEAVAERDSLIRTAAAGQVSHKEIMEAAKLKRTRVHEIIHQK